jgi:HD-like signal output (HDOD) protein
MGETQPRPSLLPVATNGSPGDEPGLARPAGPGGPSAAPGAGGGEGDEESEVLLRDVIAREPLAHEIVRLIDADLDANDLEVPRAPHLTSRILDYLSDPNLSTNEVSRFIRTDPQLSTKLIEMANSARFASAEPIFNLKLAIIRLGLRRVGEVAYELSTDIKAFHGRKRGHILARLWKFSLATGFTCEELSRHVPGVSVAGESAFLTGLLHAVAAPAILSAIGKLERQKKTRRLNDEEVQALLTLLSTLLSARVAKRWKVPVEVQEAIRLQDRPTRFRKEKPAALMLVCSKLIVRGFGLGVRAEEVDVRRNRDVRLLRVNDERKLQEVATKVRCKLGEIWKT